MHLKPGPRPALLGGAIVVAFVCAVYLWQAAHRPSLERSLRESVDAISSKNGSFFASLMTDRERASTHLSSEDLARKLETLILSSAEGWNPTGPFSYQYFPDSGIGTLEFNLASKSKAVRPVLIYGHLEGDKPRMIVLYNLSRLCCSMPFFEKSMEFIKSQPNVKKESAARRLSTLTGLVRHQAELEAAFPAGWLSDDFASEPISWSDAIETEAAVVKSTGADARLVEQFVQRESGTLWRFPADPKSYKQKAKEASTAPGPYANGS